MAGLTVLWLRMAVRAVAGLGDVTAATRACPVWSVTFRPGAISVVLFQQRGEIEAFELGGLDEIEKCLQLLGFHRIKPVQIRMADAREDSLHHRKMPDPDLAFVPGRWG